MYNKYFRILKDIIKGCFNDFGSQCVN